MSKGFLKVPQVFPMYKQNAELKLRRFKEKVEKETKQNSVCSPQFHIDEAHFVSWVFIIG